MGMCTCSRWFGLWGGEHGVREWNACDDVESDAGKSRLFRKWYDIDKNYFYKLEFYIVPCEFFRRCLASGEGGNNCDMVWCFRLPSPSVDGTIILDLVFVTESVVSRACNAISRFLLIDWMASWNSVISRVLDNALSVVKIDRPCIRGKRLLIAWSTRCCTCIVTASIWFWLDVEAVLCWCLKGVSANNLHNRGNTTYRDIILLWDLRIGSLLRTWW